MYETFYGFSECPFGISPDPRFLYMVPSHFEAFSSMLSGIKERKGITVITGEVGVGKTTLIHALLKDLDEKIKASFIFFSAMTFPQFLKKVLTDLGQPPYDSDLYSLLQSFHLCLARSLENDDKVAIVIDEAHSLNIDLLRDVGRLVSRPNPSSDILKIVLVGQPEFETKLNREELKEFRGLISLHRRVRTLDVVESEAYIDHRLRVVGSHSSLVFTPDAIDRICRFAGGIPRVINIACDTVLIEGYARMAERIDGKVVRDVLKELHHLRKERAAQQPKISPAAIKPVRGVSRYRSLAFPGAAVASALIVVLVLIVIWYFPSSPPVKGRVHLNGPIGKGVQVNQGATDMEAETIPQATAERGSNLIQMTRRHYGRASPLIIDMVLEANPSIRDMNVIFAKQGIVMPPLSEDSLILTEPDRPVKICLGTYVRRPPLKIFHNEPLLNGKLIEIVERKVSPRDTWYRVLAGPFSTREEATTTLSALRGKGFLHDLSP